MSHRTIVPQLCNPQFLSDGKRTWSTSTKMSVISDQTYTYPMKLVLRMLHQFFISLVVPYCDGIWSCIIKWLEICSTLFSKIMRLAAWFMISCMVRHQWWNWNVHWYWFASMCNYIMKFPSMQTYFQCRRRPCTTNLIVLKIINLFANNQCWIAFWYGTQILYYFAYTY
jgi:hypothetical protein